MRTLATAALCAIATGAWAANITVTSPNAGDFLGRTNTVNFTITGATKQITVTVVATFDANPAQKIQVEKDFNPDVNGKIAGTLALNFAASTPEGAYTLKVSADEQGTPLNDVPAFGINVDVRDPRFRNFNPLSGAFVRGIVPIFVSLDESNVKVWRVRINNGDIPNNSGSTTTLTVNWDTASIVNDGTQTINISVEDLAGNTSNKNIGVTLDRVRPSATILAPASGTTVRPNSRIAVVVDILDQFSGSVHQTGIDVTMTALSGVTIGRVPRRSVRAFGNKLTWTGRIRPSNRIPAEFKIVVRTTDRAGNVAVVQEVTVSTLSRGRTRGRTSRIGAGRRRR